MHVAHITLPTVISRYFKMLNYCAKSSAHMFRRSITPSKRYLSPGKPIVLLRLSVLVPCIRSKPIEEIAFNPYDDPELNGISHSIRKIRFPNPHSDFWNSNSI